MAKGFSFEEALQPATKGFSFEEALPTKPEPILTPEEQMMSSSQSSSKSISGGRSKQLLLANISKRVAKTIVSNSDKNIPLPKITKINLTNLMKSQRGISESNSPSRAISPNFRSPSLSVGNDSQFEKKMELYEIPALKITRPNDICFIQEKELLSLQEQEEERQDNESLLKRLTSTEKLMLFETYALEDLPFN